MLHHVRHLKDRCTDFLEYLPQNGEVAELGVHKGDFAEFILRVNKPRILHLVDIWPLHRMLRNGDEYITGALALSYVHERFAVEIEEGRVVIHHCDILNAKLSGLDWVYLDAFHRYYQTSKQLQACERFVKEDGYICGHDYDWSDDDFGVRRAVDEFDWVLDAVTSESICKSFILARV